jgi:hypothetical protein
MRIYLTKKETKLIQEGIAIGFTSFFDQKLRLLPMEGERFYIDLNEEELDELLDAVASDANHAETKTKQRAYDALFDKLRMTE